MFIVGSVMFSSVFGRMPSFHSRCFKFIVRVSSVASSMKGYYWPSPQYLHNMCICLGAWRAREREREGEEDGSQQSSALSGI